MLTRLFFSVLLAVQLVAGGFVPSLCWANDAEIEKIKSAWLAREERIRSFDISWTESRVSMRSSVASPLDPFAAPMPDGPKNKHEHTYKRRLVMDGGSYRFQDEAPLFYSDAAGYFPRKSLDVFNGKDAKHLFKPRPGGFQFQGDVMDPDRARDSLKSMIGLQPFAHYRPSWSVMKLLNTGTFETNAGKMNNRPCHVLRQERGDHVNSYWIDPSADFSIVQVDGLFKGKRITQHTCNYERHDEFGYVLKSWERVDTNEAGELENSVKAEVTDSKLNAKISEAEFVLNFPPGTLIQNVIDPEKPAYQIVRPDGTTRDVSQKELAESTPEEISER